VLTEKTFAEVLPAIQGQRIANDMSKKNDSPTNVEVDNEFLNCMQDRKQLLESIVEGRALVANEKSSDQLAYQALPDQADMDKILRYENSAQKRLDWALQKLWECQRRRTIIGTQEPGACRCSS
jgi:hypothetical protein